MNRIPKEKQNQLVLAVLIILTAVAGLWYGLIRFQMDTLKRFKERKTTAQAAVTRIQDMMKNSKRIESDLHDVSAKLDLAEQDMASGDLYASMVNIVRTFKLPYKIDIVQYNSAGAPVNVNLLPKFPYKQCTISISGTGHYYDIGSFVADFENHFPYARVLNLELTPTSGASADEKEKLYFRMDIVSLVTSNGSHQASIP